MKKIIVFLVIIGLGFNTDAQTRKERKALKKAESEAQFESTKVLIESGSFEFEALWANPLGNDAANIGRSLPGGAAVFQGNRVSLVGNTNFVKIDQQEADIFLPFFGRVFFPQRINNQGGITYKGLVEDYSVSVNEKKKVITLNFSGKSDNDYLKFILRITAKGGAILNVNSTNRQTISYDGSVKAFDIDNN